MLAKTKFLLALILSCMAFTCSAQLAEVVWAEYDGEQNNVLYSQWTGEDWREPESIYSNDNYVATPTLSTTKNGEKIVIWSEQRASKSVLMMSKRPNNEELWSEATLFSQHGSENVSPSLVKDRKGTLWVFWAADVDSYSDVFYSRQISGSWAAPVRVNSANQVPDIKPIANVDKDGNVEVTWGRYDFDVGDYVTETVTFEIESKIVSELDKKIILAKELDPKKLPIPGFIKPSSFATIHIANNRLITNFRLEPSSAPLEATN